jgi:DNA-directed RNA polymerase specialized sigma24 family protein
MADTSQQGREWGRHVVPPPRDVAAALAALSEEDLLRLRAIARLRVRSLPDGMSWSDLLHEAVLRALTGARPWPPGVPLLAFLGGVMRSLCDEEWRRHRRQDHLPTPHEVRAFLNEAIAASEEGSAATLPLDTCTGLDRLLGISRELRLAARYHPRASAFPAWSWRRH